MGPTVCNGLKTAYPAKVACQGVGQPYSAGLGDNVLPKGTSNAAITEATKMFTTANTKCPSTIIVFGGYRYVQTKLLSSSDILLLCCANYLYSQGTAVMMNTVSGLPADIKRKVVGGVLFGYTKNAQQKGMIPNYPKDQVKVFCDETSPGRFGDGVCGGTLNVNAGHMVYMRNGDGAKAVTFLKSKIDPHLKGR